MFDGTRTGFLAWYMSFSGFVAWKLTECTEILDGTDTLPVAPAPVAGTNPGDPPTNQADIDQEQQDIADWQKRDRKLYGLLLQAIPDWLRTSVYNAHRNQGRAAVEHLCNSFDVVDENDHAACIARLQTSYIDRKHDIREDDLRLQFDSMQTSIAGIIRAGQTAPPDATLKAMFDNALPISYSHIRQMVRRQNHASFVAHYTDYVTQVRAELASRVPTAHAFSATYASAATSGHFLPRPPGASSSSEPESPGNSVCLNCGEDGHSRKDCPKNKTKCRFCHGPHKSAFCEQSPLHLRARGVDEGAQMLQQSDAVSELALVK